jgi:hypothetical protein
MFDDRLDQRSVLVGVQRLRVIGRARLQGESISDGIIGRPGRDLGGQLPDVCAEQLDEVGRQAVRA